MLNSPHLLLLSGTVLPEHDLAATVGVAASELERRRSGRFFVEGVGSREVDLPTVWHVATIPADPSEALAERLRAALAERALVSVADDPSRERLVRAGVEREVDVVPHLAWLLPRLFDVRALEGWVDHARGTGRLPQADLLAVQGGRALLPHVDGFAGSIAEVCAARRLTPLDSVTWGRGPDDARRLRREQQARRAAGLEASWLTRRALAGLGIDGEGGIRTHGDAQIDPYKACLGFAAAAAARGAGVFERTPARKIETGRTGVRIVTAGATITAETVVLATGEPISPFSALDRHFDARESYAVLTPPLPAAVRKAAADRGAIFHDRTEPAHRMSWTSDDRILWTGADQARTPDRARDKVLVQRTGQLMYELSLVVEAISGIQPAFRRLVDLRVRIFGVDERLDHVPVHIDRPDIKMHVTLQADDLKAEPGIHHAPQIHIVERIDGRVEVARPRLAHHQQLLRGFLAQVLPHRYLVRGQVQHLVLAGALVEQEQDGLGLAAVVPTHQA
jgi:hypothetical protein